MNDRIGFQIGEDFAHYGRQLPEGVSQSIVAGYNAGKREKGKWKANRYVRKWLQLRLNAFTRGKLFSGEITPELLKSIDADYCPITGIMLTHATGKDSDWSIDRVSNDFDYIPTNLIVMSTIANKAKGDKSSDRIIQISESLDGPLEGLNADEWKRMAELVRWAKYRQMSREELEKVDSKELFLSSLLKGEEPIQKAHYSHVAVFQMFLLKMLDAGRKPPAEIDRVLNKDKGSRLLFHKLWNRLVKRQSHYLYNEQYKQWSNQKTLILYVKWIMLHNINNLERFLTLYAGSQFSESLEIIHKREERFLR
jgi:hypothetical protein